MPNKMPCWIWILCVLALGTGGTVVASFSCSGDDTHPPTDAVDAEDATSPADVLPETATDVPSDAPADITPEAIGDMGEEAQPEVASDVPPADTALPSDAVEPETAPDAPASDVPAAD